VVAPGQGRPSQFDPQIDWLVHRHHVGADATVATDFSCPVADPLFDEQCRDEGQLWRSRECLDSFPAATPGDRVRLSRPVDLTTVPDA
jgi:hypothetical protein